jgi:transposase
VIAAIVQESNYSRRSVVNHAKDLGVWCKFKQSRIECELSIVRLLSSSATQEDPLDVIATKLRITRAAARRRIYRDDECVESLVGGTYSAREVAEGFCIRRSTLSALIQSGLLRAKQLQRTGKLRISSDAIVDFVLAYPRQIQWSRCLEKSSWLRDILESARYQQVAALLCVSPKTVRSWIDRGILHLRFDSNNVSELLSDEPIYQLLDEFPDLVNLPKCVAANPEWFARYEAVRGRYPKRPLPVDNPKTAAQDHSASFRILLRRG